MGQKPIQSRQVYYSTEWICYVFHRSAFETTYVPHAELLCNIYVTYYIRCMYEYTLIIDFIIHWAKSVQILHFLIKDKCRIGTG